MHILLEDRLGCRGVQGKQRTCSRAVKDSPTSAEANNKPPLRMRRCPSAHAEEAFHECLTPDSTQTTTPGSA